MFFAATKKIDSFRSPIVEVVEPTLIYTFKPFVIECPVAPTHLLPPPITLHGNSLNIMSEDICPSGFAHM